jgi:hypothetical protein
MKRDASEQVIPAAGVVDGGENAIRRFRYGSDREIGAHVAYAVQRSLASEASPGSIAILARHWAALDPVRALLEDAGIPFVIHHSAFHRPAHRRHPGAKILRKLWETPARIDGHAEDWVRVVCEEWKRSLDEPSIAELLSAAREIDRERIPLDGGPVLTPLGSVELADGLLLAQRAWSSTRSSCFRRVAEKTPTSFAPSTWR